MRVDRSRGFTLLEVLVAFVIVALALGGLFGGGLESLRSARIASREELAVARAQSRLAALTVGGAFAAREESGDDGDGFRWRTRIAPEGSASIAPGPDGGSGVRAGLWQLTVAVEWTADGARRSVVLTTERLGAAAPST